MSIPPPDPARPAAPQQPAGSRAAGRDSAPVDPSTNGHDPIGELKAAAGNLAEIPTYLAQLVGAKVSGLLYGVRKLALLSMIGAVVAVAGISMLVTCGVLLVLGISRFLEWLLPDYLDWLAMTLVGFGGILLATLTVFIVLRRAAAVGKRMALEQYRTALREQRKAFGHDAFSRSAAEAAEQHLRARAAPARTPEQVKALREKQVEAEKAQRRMEEDFHRIKGG